MKRHPTQQYEVRLPHLHADQRAVVEQTRNARFVHLRAGRRWGKSHLLARMLAEAALVQRQTVGYFAPTYKLILPVWEQARRVLRVVANEHKTERRIDTTTGGRIEFWSLDNENAGRSRGYDLIVVDEAGLVRNLETIWRENLIPALLDRRGRAVLAGTPKGRGGFWRVYQTALEDPHHWATVRRSTNDNPLLDPADIALLRSAMTERAARQELDAEFLDDGGAVFRNVRACVGAIKRSNEAAVIGVDWGRYEDATVFAALDPQTRCVVDVERLVDVDFAAQRRALVAFWKRNGGGVVIAEVNSIGAPNIEELQRAGLPVQAFTTTAATKPLLIDTLALALEQRTVVLPELDWLLNELEMFSVEIGASGRMRYSAPEGCHDDGVIALALAAWGAARGAEVLFDV